MHLHSSLSSLNFSCPPFFEGSYFSHYIGISQLHFILLSISESDCPILTKFTMEQAEQWICHVLDHKQAATEIFHSDTREADFANYREPYLPDDVAKDLEAKDAEMVVKVTVPEELKTQRHSQADKVQMQSSYQYDRVDMFLKVSACKTLKPVHSDVVGDCLFDAILEQSNINKKVFSATHLRRCLCVMAALLFDKVFDQHAAFLL